MTEKHSSIATAGSEDFNWDDIFYGTSWFHFSGITPALSDNTAAICLQACKKARQKGLTVSCDLNYRKNLWSGEKANQIMTEMMPYVNVCIANEEDAEKVFGIHADNTNVASGKVCYEAYVEVARQLTERFGFDTVAITLRGSISASVNDWAAMVYRKGESWFSKSYRIHLIDRVGGGDSFGGALIFSLISGMNHKKRLI